MTNSTKSKIKWDYFSQKNFVQKWDYFPQNTNNRTINNASSVYDFDNFDTYSNFYTILKKDTKSKKKHKVIYGHFFDNADLFIYKPEHQTKFNRYNIVNSYMLAKTDIEDFYFFNDSYSAQYVANQLDLL